MNKKNEQTTVDQSNEDSKKSFIDLIAKEPTIREQDLNRGNLNSNGEPTLIYPRADRSKKQ